MGSVVKASVDGLIWGILRENAASQIQEFNIEHGTLTSIHNSRTLCVLESIISCNIFLLCDTFIVIQPALHIL